MYFTTILKNSLSEANSSLPLQSHLSLAKGPSSGKPHTTHKRATATSGCFDQHTANEAMGASGPNNTSLRGHRDCHGAVSTGKDVHIEGGDRVYRSGQRKPVGGQEPNTRVQREAVMTDFVGQTETLPGVLRRALVAGAREL